MARRLPALLALLAAACSSGPATRALDEAALTLAEPCIVPLAERERPVVELLLDGRSAGRFLVDSGSSISLLGAAKAAELGLERRPYASRFEAMGSGGKSATLEHYVRVGRLELGKLLVHDTRLTVVDDPALAQAGVDGILGQDLLVRLVLVLDLQRHELHLLPRGGTEVLREYLRSAEVGDGAWAMAPIAFRPCPFLPLEVAGLESSVELELDTGAGSTSLPRAAIAALGLEPIGTHTLGSVGGNYDAELYALEDFGLFGLRIQTNVTAAVGEYGLLGMDILGELVVVLDGPARTLWLHRRE